MYRNGTVMLLWMLVGCAHKGSDEQTDTPPGATNAGESANVEDNTSDGDSGIETEEYTTWYKDVQPLMKHCTRCHHDGGLGVGDFEPAIVSAMAKLCLAR